MKNVEPAKKKDETTFVCTPSEKEIIQLLRSMSFGELTVSVRNGEPVRVEEVRRSIMIK